MVVFHSAVNWIPLKDFIKITRYVDSIPILTESLAAMDATIVYFGIFLL